jgi:acetylornithine deacetylase
MTAVGERVEALRALRAWVDARADELVAFTGDLIRVPSLVGTTAQNDCQRLVADALRASDVATDVWSPPWERVRELTQADGTRLWVPVEQRHRGYAAVLDELTCVAGSVGDTGRHVVLNGHVDVVPADDQPGWSSRPFEPRLERGWLYGRGAMDMKSGLAAAVYAVKALAELGLVERGRVTVASVVEEESGGNGTLAALEHGLIGDGVVFCESTDLQVVHRHVGIQQFRVDVRGRSGGMLRRGSGESAIVPMARVVIALDELEHARTQAEHERGGYDPDDEPGFVNVAFIEGGEWLASRPENCSIRGLMGVLPGETPAAAAAALRTTVHAATPHAAHVEVAAGAHGGAELPADHPLVAAFVAAGAAVGHGVGRPTRAGALVCDAKIVHGGGFAPAVALGPAGVGLHAPDERVEVQSVLRLVETLALGALAFIDASQ